MKFPVHVSCGYPSYKEAGIKWEDLEFKAWKLVKAIKGEPVNGYAMFGNERVEGTTAGRATALKLASSDAAQKLDQAGIRGALVPVPSSKHTCLGNAFTGSRLADAIAAKAPGTFNAAPLLCFDQEMPKSADGGTRSPSELAAHLVLGPGANFDECILIDDVTTTGGHLRGAARFLEQNGKRVIGAYCVAQTVWTRPQHLFRIPPAELDSQPDWFDL